MCTRPAVSEDTTFLRSSCLLLHTYTDLMLVTTKEWIQDSPSLDRGFIAWFFIVICNLSLSLFLVSGHDI